MIPLENSSDFHFLKFLQKLCKHRLLPSNYCLNLKCLLREYWKYPMLACHTKNDCKTRHICPYTSGKQFTFVHNAEYLSRTYLRGVLHSLAPTATQLFLQVTLGYSEWASRHVLLSCCLKT